MATANADEQGAARWIGSRTLGFVVGFPIFFGFVAMLAAPALLVINRFVPEAMGLAWFTVAGATALLIGLLDSGATSDVEDISEEMEELPLWQNLIAALYAWLLSAGGTSARVAVGSLGAFILMPIVGPAAIMIAAFWPMIDSWAARLTGVSVGVFGVYVAYALVVVVSVALDIEDDIGRRMRGGVTRAFGGRY
jgi:hypothetical protein